MRTSGPLLSRFDVLSGRAPARFPATVPWVLRQTIEMLPRPCVRHGSTPADLRGRLPVPLSFVTERSAALWFPSGVVLDSFLQVSTSFRSPSERIGRSARRLRPALFRAFNHRSPLGDQRASLLPYAPAPGCLGVLAGAGGCPGTSTSDLCALVGDSCFGLGRGRAVRVYWCHLAGICCGVMHAWCPGLMHVQRP